MNDERLSEIESHISYYRAENIKREGISHFETFDPNGEIRELVNEVRSLKSKIEYLKRKINNSGQDGTPTEGWRLCAMNRLERIEEFKKELGIVKDNLLYVFELREKESKAHSELKESEDWPVNWEEMAAAFKLQINELETTIKDSVELFKEQDELIRKAEAVQTDLMKKNQELKKEHVIFDMDSIPESGWKRYAKARMVQIKDLIIKLEKLEKELTRYKDLVDSQMDRLREFEDEIAKCHEFIQDEERNTREEFYLQAGRNVVDVILDYARKLERMVERACEEAAYSVTSTKVTREWLEE